jgi:hypothetical protein
LLHDIGKPECWAKRKPWSEHVWYTKEALTPYLGEELALTAMRHHIGESYPEDYRSKTTEERIIHVADILASGADRPEDPKYTGGLPTPPIKLTHPLSKGETSLAELQTSDLMMASEEAKAIIKGTSDLIDKTPGRGVH